MADLIRATGNGRTEPSHILTKHGCPNTASNSAEEADMSRDKKKAFAEVSEVAQGTLVGGAAGGAVGAAAGMLAAGAASAGVGLLAGGLTGAAAGAATGAAYVEADQAERERDAAEAEAAVMDEAQDIHAQGELTGPEAIAQARENQR